MINPDELLARRRAVERDAWRGEVPEQLFARLAASPVVGDALCGLGDALLSALDGHVLELIALRVSAVRDCPYVWRGHCVIALRRPVGALGADEIARVAAGPAALSGDDAVVVQAVDELLAHGNMPYSTRSRLGSMALDVMLAAKFYATIVAIMHDAEPEAAPVAGLETPALAASRSGW